MLNHLNSRVCELRKSVLNLLENSRMISELVEIAAKEGHQLYLVGGFIRDHFLERRSKDIDFVSSEAADLTKSFARRTGNRPVVIDQKFGTIRLIPVAESQAAGELHQVDLSPLRGLSIEDDLNKRDFTINALAVDLSGWNQPDSLELIDPLNGMADLEASRLRACKRSSFNDDPLRILRAYRFSSTYGFTLESQTREWMVSMRRGLEGVAKERIRDELVLILSAPNSATTLRMLDDDHIIELILPECGPMRDLRQDDYHHQDVWNHSLSALGELENFLANPSELSENYVQEAQASLSLKLTAERTRETMLKLGVLLHKIGKPGCKTVDEDGGTHFYGHEVAGARLAASLCSRLRFSNKEIEFVRQLIRQHMRAIHLFNIASPSRRSLSRFFRLGPELFWPLIMLFASDYRARLGPKSLAGDMAQLRERIHSWLDFYHQQLKPMEIKPPLISGRDLIRHFHLAPGPAVGRLLKTLTELQWEGRINNREEALQKAAQLLQKWSRSGQETVG